MRMRGVYIGKALRVSLTHLSMWDKISEKQRVRSKKTHVRTARSRVQTWGLHLADGEREEKSLEKKKPQCRLALQLNRLAEWAAALRQPFPGFGRG